MDFSIYRFRGRLSLSRDRTERGIAVVRIAVQHCAPYRQVGTWQ
jgi:hypothetical protein